jgi:cytochrome c-type biogenesis protein CcmH/NrfF
MICKQCNARNRNNARFCAECGCTMQQSPASVSNKHEEIRKNSSEKVHKQPERMKNSSASKLYRWNPNHTGSTILGTLVVAALAVFVFKQNQIQEPMQTTEIKSNNPTIELSLASLASKFICSCGSCGGKSLDVCPCDTAVEERRVIRKYLEEGHQHDQIIAAVNKNFGGLKPEFQAQHGSSSNETKRITAP